MPLAVQQGSKSMGNLYIYILLQQPELSKTQIYKRKYMIPPFKMFIIYFG